MAMQVARDGPAGVMIFRVGSIGDFVISLPCFHAVRDRFPEAEITLLTNLPGNDEIIPAQDVLRGTGLVDRYITYDGGTRDPARLRALRAEIRAHRPGLLVYLAPARHLASAYRDLVFFRWCGIRRIIGLPLIPSRIAVRSPQPGSHLWESEARRLGRRIKALREIDFDDARSWDLRLGADELRQARQLLEDAFPALLRGNGRLIGLSIGTKQPVKDWGDRNWKAVIDSLREVCSGLVVIGGLQDRRRSQHLVEAWGDAALNLCGRISVRISAAVLRHLPVFLCHDSGPMHLAAAVGTQCVAIFSQHNLPGEWFPAGAGHKVLYPTGKQAAIGAIPPRQVIAAVVEALDGARKDRFAAGAEPLCAA